MTSRTVEVSIPEDGGMRVIPVPFDPKAVFGKVRAPVKVTINGYTFRSTIARMGGETFIPLRSSNREAAAIEGRKRISVLIALDTEQRVIEPPADLRRALKGETGIWKRWQTLSYTHRRECVESVLGAKRPETRERRIAKVVTFVAEHGVARGSRP